MSNLPRPSKDTGWRLFGADNGRSRVSTSDRPAAPTVVDVLRGHAAAGRTVGARVRVPGNRAPADFVGFVILGGAMSAFWLNVLWAMANQLYSEKQTGNLPLTSSPPTRSWPFSSAWRWAVCSPPRCEQAAILVLGSWFRCPVHGHRRMGAGRRLSSRSVPCTGWG